MIMINIIITTATTYGSRFNDPTNLIVQGITTGTINFYIEGVDTGVTYLFKSGAFTELNLSADIPEGNGNGNGPEPEPNEQPIACK